MTQSVANLLEVGSSKKQEESSFLDTLIKDGSGTLIASLQALLSKAHY